MEVRRTVPVTLNVEGDDATLLHETIDEFLFAAQYVTDHAFKGEYVTTNKAQLQDETYDEVRDRTPLNAGLVQNARNKAAEACKSVVARWEQGRKRRSHVSRLRTSSTTIVRRLSTTIT